MSNAALTRRELVVERDYANIAITNAGAFLYLTR